MAKVNASVRLSAPNVRSYDLEIDFTTGDASIAPGMGGTAGLVLLWVGLNDDGRHRLQVVLQEVANKLAELRTLGCP